MQASLASSSQSPPLLTSAPSTSEPSPSSLGASWGAWASSSTPSSGGTTSTILRPSGVTSVSRAHLSFFPSLTSSFPRFAGTRIHLGLTTGISAGCLCINRRLSIISSAKRPSVSARERRRELWIDVAIVVAPPFWVMIIYYTVQGNRFNLSEGSGCQPAVYVSWPAILAVYVPPLLVGCISFVYGGSSSLSCFPLSHSEAHLGFFR